MDQSDSRAGMSQRLLPGIGVLAVDRVTAEVVTAFDTAGVRSILLKGPAHQRWLYGASVEHVYGDTDLLLPPDQFAQARKLLGGLGFTIVLDDDDVDGLPQHGHHWVRSGRAGHSTGVVDLHRTLYGAAVEAKTVWEVLSRQTEKLSVGGVEMWILEPGARALHVALHALQHPAPERISTHARADLRRALEIATPQTWAAAAALAQQLGAESAFSAGIRLEPEGLAIAERLTIDDTPSSETLRKLPGAPPGLDALQRLGEIGGWSARTRFCARKLVPTPALMRSWSGLARKGRAGLGAAYLLRPLWVLWRLPVALFRRRQVKRAAPSR